MEIKEFGKKKKKKKITESRKKTNKGILGKIRWLS